jgi:uncharacterized protein YcbK (DUF882 family)
MPTRRRFLASAAAFGAGLAAPAVVRANPTGVVGANRLWVIRAFDGERLDAPIRLQSEEGTRNAWMLWSHFWRDVKDDGRAVWIDMALLDRLSAVQVEMSRQRGEEVPLILTSGYRTPERNRTLEGAAPNSLHVTGRAADFTGRGFTARQTADIIDAHPAWGNGGLGRYEGFTHLDTGPRRRWGRN